MNAYRYEINQASIAAFRATTVEDKLIQLDPDGFVCESREQGDEILSRNDWTADVRPVNASDWQE